jgi:hypothetical protein
VIAQSDIGIVLKKISVSEHKFSVLTKTRGKIILIVFDYHNAKKLQAGTLISFIPDQFNKAIHTTKSIDIMAVSSGTNTLDMYWFHHLLELCYFFTPLHQPIDDVFCIISHCLALPAYQQAIEEDEWAVTKKLCVGVLLMHLGFYPTEALTPPLISTKKTLLLFIDFNESQKVEFLRSNLRGLINTSSNALDEWLLCCIHSHPCTKAFKTLRFMYNNPQP